MPARTVLISLPTPKNSIMIFPILQGRKAVRKRSWNSSGKFVKRSNNTAGTLSGNIYNSFERTWNGLTLPRRKPVLQMTSCRSEEHTSELQSLMRISYAVFCLKKKRKHIDHKYT